MEWLNKEGYGTLTTGAAQERMETLRGDLYSVMEMYKLMMVTIKMMCFILYE